MFYKILKNKKAYTLAELILVMVITGILLAVGILSISNNSEKSNLKKSYLLFAEDLRKVQNYSMTGYKEGSSLPGAYGIFIKDSNTYNLFQDLNSNDTYDSGEEIETKNLSNNITFDLTNISPTACSINGCTIISRLPKGSFCYDNDNSTNLDTDCNANEIIIPIKSEQFSENIKINTFSGKVSY